MASEIISALLHFAALSQYVALAIIWGILLLTSVYRLAIREPIDKFAFCTLWASVWYIAIQTHWVLHMAHKIPGWTELLWSVFEAFIGVLLLYALTRRR
jgi:hypothetical protein